MALLVYHRAAEELEAALASDFRGLHCHFGDAVPDAEDFDEAFSLPCLAGVDQPALFQAVGRWALEELRGDLTVFPTAPEPQGWARDVRQFTARRCRGILANALLGNVRDVMAERKCNQGGLRFNRLGPQKLAALLLYFQAGLQGDAADDERVVRFEHVRCPPIEEVEAFLSSCDEALLLPSQEPPLVRLHDAGMEAPAHAAAFVNFANAQFGYGKFIESCTQEEILQQCCPEFNVGMLFIGTMAEDEVVVVHNCRRYVTYRGYGDTFEVIGPAPGPVQAILTLDACRARHFARAAVLRDVRKAYTAFAALHGPAGPPSADAAPPALVPVVSTGRWGCGVFGGTPAHKFLQQLLAACLAGVALEFSTFGNPQGCDAVLAALQQSQATLKQVWAILQQCTSAATFVSDVVQRLGPGGGGPGCSSQ
eukprot:EG_transcript_11476